LKAIDVKITSQNIESLINSGKVYLQTRNDKSFPIGNADFEALKFANSVQMRPATQEDINYLLSCPAKTIYVTPIG
jgi:hypothetical protein